jgi:hypothetical protein
MTTVQLDNHMAVCNVSSCNGLFLADACRTKKKDLRDVSKQKLGWYSDTQCLCFWRLCYSKFLLFHRIRQDFACLFIMLYFVSFCFSLIRDDVTERLFPLLSHFTLFIYSHIFLSLFLFLYSIPAPRHLLYDSGIFRLILLSASCILKSITRVT